MLIGICSSSLAFFIPGASDLLVTGLFDFSPDPVWLIRSGTLFLIFAISLAILFELTFFLFLSLAAFFSRFEKIWNPAGPGVFFFVTILEPVFRHILTGNGPLFPWTFLYGMGLVLLIALGLSVFPVFRGYNVTFLVLSAILVRYTTNQLQTGLLNGNQDFYIEHPIFLAQVTFFYLLIQQRYRLRLSNGYDPISTPWGYLLTAVLISLITGWGFYHFTYIRFDPAPGINLLVLTVLLFDWSLMALSTNLINRFHLYLSIPIVPLILTAVLLGSGIYSITRMVESVNHPPPARTVATSLLMEKIGSVLDSDGDGISLWPGQDPDDHNRCSGPRYPLCENQTHLPESIPGFKTDQFTLITVDSEETLKLHNDAREGILFESETLLPSNRTLENLYFLGHPGAPLDQNPDGEGILSQSVMAGYRTICSLHLTYPNGVDSNQFDLLNRGCQIFESSLEKSDSFLEKSTMLFARYREEKAIYWIHEHRTEPTDKSWRGHFDSLVKRQRKRGPVLIVSMHLKNTPIGWLTLLSKDVEKSEKSKSRRKKEEDLQEELPVPPVVGSYQSYLFTGLGSRPTRQKPIQTGFYRQDGEPSFTIPGSVYYVLERNPLRIEFYRGRTGYTTIQPDWPRTFYPR